MSPVTPTIPLAVHGTVAISTTGLSLFIPGVITILSPVFRGIAFTLTRFFPKNPILPNARLGALTPGPPGLPLPVNPVAAEIILRCSLTIRTLRTPLLPFAGVEIVLARAVQTLSGVLSWCGARGTFNTGQPVVGVTDIVQELAGGTAESLCAGPGTLRTLETALGVGVEDVVGRTAVQALAGVGGIWPKTVLTADFTARGVEAGLTLWTD